MQELRRSRQRQWEYHLSGMPSYSDATHEKVKEQLNVYLNQMGAEGWELIGINPCVFKRQFSDRPEKQEPLTESFVLGASHKTQSIQVFELRNAADTCVAYKWMTENGEGTAVDKERALEQATRAIDEDLKDKNNV